MKTLQQDTLQLRQSAIVAGISLIIMAFAALFSYGFVHSSLIIIGDSITTFEKIQGAFGIFNAGLLGWLVIIIADLLVSWALYIYLKPLHHSYSLLAAWLRLIYTAVLTIAISYLIQVTNLVNQNGQLFSQPVDTLAFQVMLSLRTFESVWSLGLIVFGLHLLVLGFAASKTRTIPKVISILLSIAGASYILIHLLYGFFPTLENLTSTLEMILSIPMIVGELGFGIWLLLKGGKTPFLN